MCLCRHAWYAIPWHDGYAPSRTQRHAAAQCGHHGHGSGRRGWSFTPQQHSRRPRPGLSPQASIRQRSAEDREVSRCFRKCLTPRGFMQRHVKIILVKIFCFQYDVIHLPSPVRNILKKASDTPDQLYRPTQLAAWAMKFQLHGQSCRNSLDWGTLLTRGEELLDLIQKPTAKETATVKRFKTEGGPAVREYCPHLTKDDCSRQVMSIYCQAVSWLIVITNFWSMGKSWSGWAPPLEAALPLILRPIVSVSVTQGKLKYVLTRTSAAARMTSAWIHHGEWHLYPGGTTAARWAKKIVPLLMSVSSGMCTCLQGARCPLRLQAPALPAPGLSLDGPVPGQLQLPGHVPPHEDLPLRALPAGRRPGAARGCGRPGARQAHQAGRAQLPGGGATVSQLVPASGNHDHVRDSSERLLKVQRSPWILNWINPSWQKSSYKM